MLHLSKHLNWYSSRDTHDFEEQTANPEKFLDISYEIVGEELHLVIYFKN